MDISKLMSQFYDMQNQAEEKQKELEAKEFVGSASGGAVTVKVTGDHVVREIKIDPDMANPDDIEILQDSIIAAINDAESKIAKEQEELASSMTGGLGGLGIPGF